MWRHRATFSTNSTRARKSQPSCLSQIFANERTKYMRLELMIAANIKPGDVVGVLTYDDKHLPGCRRDVLSDLAYFRKKLSASCRARGSPLRLIWCIEGQHSDNVHQGARYHIHFVMPRMADDFSEIRRCWTKGIVLLARFTVDARKWARALRVSERNLHRASDGSFLGYEPLARYMCKEHPEFNSCRTWSYTFKTCLKPVVDSRAVPDDYRLRRPPDCIMLNDAHESSTGFETVKYLSKFDL